MFPTFENSIYGYHFKELGHIVATRDIEVAKDNIQNVVEKTLNCPTRFNGEMLEILKRSNWHRLYDIYQERKFQDLYSLKKATDTYFSFFPAIVYHGGYFELKEFGVMGTFPLDARQNLSYILESQGLDVRWSAKDLWVSNTEKYQRAGDIFMKEPFSTTVEFLRIFHQHKITIYNKITLVANEVRLSQ